MNKKKILLADDEEDIKIVIKIYLESKGHTVVTAFDGLDAIDKAESEKPDLILLDIMMPIMNGFEVCSRLKENKATASIPIVMLSAASQKDSVEKGLSVGAVDYIIKPFETTKLDEVMTKIFGK